MRARVKGDLKKGKDEVCVSASEIVVSARLVHFSVCRKYISGVTVSGNVTVYTLSLGHSEITESTARSRLTVIPSFGSFQRIDDKRSESPKLFNFCEHEQEDVRTPQTMFQDLYRT